MHANCTPPQTLGLQQFNPSVPMQDSSSTDDVYMTTRKTMALRIYLALSEPLFNDDQRQIYDRICHAVDSNTGGIYFLDAPGSTGKTFLLNCLSANVCHRKDVALAVASSTLLKLGRTAHSRFKLPIPYDENSICNITPRSASAVALN